MNKLFNVVAGLYHVLAKYPSIAAGLANIVVVMAATFGFHLTANQVVTVVSFTAAVTAVLVHAGVIPMHEAKKGNVPAKVEKAVKAK
jgi:hypothetical protein